MPSILNNHARRSRPRASFGLRFRRSNTRSQYLRRSSPSLDGCRHVGASVVHDWLMSDASSEELKNKFREFDTDGNGSIDEKEFGNLVRALGLELSAGEIQIAYSAIDINGNGRIDFGEFKTWWSKR